MAMYIGRSRADSFRNLFKELSKERAEVIDRMVKTAKDTFRPDITARAVLLADIVSYEFGVTARGWESATDEQFTTLVQALKGRLRNNANTDECVPTVQRDE